LKEFPATDVALLAPQSNERNRTRASLISRFRIVLRFWMP
jgi:hypothetical protein